MLNQIVNAPCVLFCPFYGVPPARDYAASA